MGPIPHNRIVRRSTPGIVQLQDQCHRNAQRYIHTSNVIEQLNREIRRTRVVGCFPDGNSALVLVCVRLRHMAGTQRGTRKRNKNL